MPRSRRVILYKFKVKVIFIPLPSAVYFNVKKVFLTEDLCEIYTDCVELHCSLELDAKCKHTKSLL